MLSHKTVSCLKTVLGQFTSCLGLGLSLTVYVLIFTLTVRKADVPKMLNVDQVKNGIHQLSLKSERRLIYCITHLRLLVRKETLAKTLATINHEDCYADEQTNVFASRVRSHQSTILRACIICRCRACFFFSGRA